MKFLVATVTIFVCSLTANAQDDPNQAILEELFGHHESLASLESAIEEAQGQTQKRSYHL